jgi:hypothetical protein
MVDRNGSDKIRINQKSVSYLDVGLQAQHSQ